MKDASALAATKIVVTRPIAQALSLKQRIEEYGGEVVLLPLLDILPVQDRSSLIHAVKELTHFNCLIFISPNAVRFGMAAIQSAHLPNVASLPCAAIGQGTAQQLYAHGIQNVLVPIERFDSEGLLDRAEFQQIRGQKMAIFRGDHGRELLADTLRSRGAEVTYITCYQRREAAIQIEMLRQQNPQAWTISSSEALHYLVQNLQRNGLSSLMQAPIFVPHPRIAALAEQQGWKIIIPTQNGDDGILSSLIAWRTASTRSPNFANSNLERT